MEESTHAPVVRSAGSEGSPTGADRSLSMADRVDQFDWSTTPLGPMDRWPASLRTAVGLCLASPTPSLVWWGPDLINIYNDAHAPQLAEKHPAALGMPAAEVWAPVWHIVGDRVEAVMKRGESIMREREKLVMKRAGFPDEMYFTFTFSPIPDDDGGIGGVFHIAIDETARVVAEMESRAAQTRLEQQLQLASADAQSRFAHWHSVVANMAEGVILADMTGSMLDWNPAALEIHGYGSSREIGDNLVDLREHFHVYELNGSLVEFDQWPLSRLLRGDRVRNLELRVHRVNRQPDLVIIYNGTLIRDEGNLPRMALMTLHDATDRHHRPPNTNKLQRPRFKDEDDQSSRQSADSAASAVDALLHKMHLTRAEREFCASLGQHLVQNAIDTYLLCNQHTKKYDGSCIAASLAVAMIIIHEE